MKHKCGAKTSKGTLCKNITGMNRCHLHTLAKVIPEEQWSDEIDQYSTNDNSTDRYTSASGIYGINEMPIDVFGKIYEYGGNITNVTKQIQDNMKIVNRYGKKTVYTHYDDDKKQLKEAYDEKDGKKVGQYTKWDKQNNIVEIINYKRGLKHGKFKIISNSKFKINGKTETGSYKDGVKHGTFKTAEFRGVSDIIGYRDGKKHGVHTKYSNGHMLWEHTYKNGKLNGLVVIYKLHPTRRGNSDILEENLYKNNRRHGISKTYNEKGKLILISRYNMGKLDGKRIEYDDRGKLIEEVLFKQGKRIV